MQIIAYDSETKPITDEDKFPLVVCGSFHHTSGSSLVHQTDLLPRVRAMLQAALRGEVLIVCHNAPFDMGVLIRNYPSLFSLIVECFNQDRIACTEARARLLDIATGVSAADTPFDKFLLSGKREAVTYKLDNLSRRFLGWSIPGKGLVTNTYGELINTPVELWSELQRQYPIYDAVAAHDLYLVQDRSRKYLQDEFRQVRAAMWIRAMTARGICTDEAKVKAFETLKTKEMWDLVRELQSKDLPPEHQGLISVVKDGDGYRPKKNTIKTRELLLATWDPELGSIPMTKGGKKSPPKAKLDNDTILKSGVPILLKYAALTKVQRKVSTVIPALMRGIYHPIHSHFKYLLTTGRISSSDPNIQNTDREPGMRECFVPSQPEWCFVQSDWSGAELCAWAQICYVLFGFSAMRDAINAGLDPHLKLAGDLLGVPYADLDRSNPEHENARTLAKIANFGFMGGMVPATFIEYAYGYGVILTLAEATQLKMLWERSWPEQVPYFKFIKAQVRTGQIQQMYSNRYRAKCSFPQAANTLFQGLISEVMKDTGWELFKASYLDPSSPLYGYHVVNVIHDEFILEGPEAGAAEAAEELSRIMVMVARKWMPDLHIVAEPCLMNCWSKKAKSIRDANGRLEVWRYAA